LKKISVKFSFSNLETRVFPHRI